MHALVYHERDPVEHGSLQEKIEASVETDEHRQEVFDMGKTIAQALIEEGMEKEKVNSRQTMLIRLLDKRFGRVPDETLQAIQATQDVDQLDGWLDRLVTAKSLRDVGIRARV